MFTISCSQADEPGAHGSNREYLLQVAVQAVALVQAATPERCMLLVLDFVHQTKDENCCQLEPFEVGSDRKHGKLKQLCLVDGGGKQENVISSLQYHRRGGNGHLCCRKYVHFELLINLESTLAS